MKGLLKTLVRGALGIGALYVVGKICYEAGKETAEVERQLEKQIKDGETHKDRPEEPEVTRMPCNHQDGEQMKMDLDEEDGDAHIDNTPNDTHTKVEQIINEAWENARKPGMIDRAMQKIRGMKIFLRAKKAFAREDKSPGVLGTLLRNPEGARIEAFVRNGGVQIHVTPAAA